MTEELREKYSEDKVHYDVIRSIVQEEVKMAVAPVQADVKSINQRQNWFYSLSLLVFGFLFGVQFFVWKEISVKANAGDVLGKLQYYQIEVDEHRMMKEIFANPSRSIYVFDQINDNIERDLGLFRYTTRGGEK